MTIYRETFDQTVAIMRKLFGRTGARELAYEWCTYEESHRYHVGVPSWSDREALILIIAAARSLCGLNRRTAVRRLKAAIRNIEARKNEPYWSWEEV